MDTPRDLLRRMFDAAINAAQDYLPADLPIHPTYRKVNPSEAPILGLAVDDRARVPEQSRPHQLEVGGACPARHHPVIGPNPVAINA